MMKLETITDLISTTKKCPSKWELETIIWADRTTNANVLLDFLERINELNLLTNRTKDQEQELVYLTEILEDLNEMECRAILSKSNDISRDLFIENLARKAAIEVLCNHRASEETMTVACKLSPNDFILYAKRAQDLIDAIKALAIKGEKLSKDVAGA